MATRTNDIKRWIEQLNDGSSNDRTVIEALMNLRPLSKQDSGIKEIDNQGGIEALLNLIQRPNRRLLDVSISILANCLTKKCVIKKVVKCEGIRKIVKVLQTIKTEAIIMRTCRALANLANNPEASKIIFATGAVELIIKLVKETPESDSPYCISSAIRALRNLASTPKHRKKLIQFGVVGAASKRLKTSQAMIIVNEALRLLAAVSKSCTLEFADHMLAYDATPIKSIVELLDQDPDEVDPSALTILINLTLQGCARPAIGNAGCCHIFVHELEKYLDTDEELPEHFFQLVGAICYCCREAINSILDRPIALILWAKLRELPTLSYFLKILMADKCESIHTFIFATLLCFLFDERGSQDLHQDGLFSVLLQKLLEYTIAESKKAKENGVEGASKETKEIWDGQNDTDENFDKRHSLSSDLPTRFNQRPLVPEEDSASIINELTDFDFHWGNLNYQAPNTPQWSPIGPSPTPDGNLEEDSDGVSPPDSPDPVQPEEREHEPFENLLGELLDQDESSSSRDGFDQMHSPALLPLATPFNFGETSNIEKRDREDSESFNSSNDNASHQDNGNTEFSLMMAKDLCQAPKRAKMDDIKENDRVRSTSLDTGITNGPKSLPIKIPDAGPSSPKPEVTLPDMGNAACSPSFLRFVNDTCSVPPIVLKQAGRDLASSSEDTSATTTASSWKQTRRRVSGAARKIDELGNVIPDEANTTAETPTKNTVPEITKAVSNPLPMSTEKPTSTDQMTDYSIVVSEPMTPIQIILRLLCHYCEKSNDYVGSLVTENEIANCFYTYVRSFPEPLDRKFHRIIDRLSSCPESFKCFVTSFLLPNVAAAASQRMLQTRKFDHQKQLQTLCEDCKMQISSECNNLLDNMWHNIALAYSSSYCAVSIAKMIQKEDDSSIAGACATILVSLWFLSSKSRMENMSESMQKSILSILRLIQGHEILKLLCDVYFAPNSIPMMYQSCSHTLYMLMEYSRRFKKSECLIEWSDGDSPDIFADVEENDETFKFDGIMNLFSKSTSGTIDAQVEEERQSQSYCQYDQQCAKIQPDKVLVFLQELYTVDDKTAQQIGNRTRSKTKGENINIKPKIVDNSISVHSDILSNSSPMFEAMLSGNYRESSETTIRIQDISYSTALYIIHSIYGCTDDNCKVMKNIWTEASNSSQTHYERFCKYQSQTEPIASCPTEIDILKVMDRWILETERKEYYRRHLKYFSYWYIRKEVMNAGLISVKKDHLDSTLNCIGSNSKSETTISVKIEHTEKLFSSDYKYYKDIPLLKFAINHSFSDILQSVIQCLFSPCFFRHQSLSHGKTLAIINAEFDDSTFYDLFQNNVEDGLKGIIAELEKR